MNQSLFQCNISKVISQVFGACDWKMRNTKKMKTKLDTFCSLCFLEKTVTQKALALQRNTSTAAQINGLRLNPFDWAHIFKMRICNVSWREFYVQRVGFCLFSHYFISIWNLSILFDPYIQCSLSLFVYLHGNVCWKLNVWSSNSIPKKWAGSKY